MSKKNIVIIASIVIAIIIIAVAINTFTDSGDAKETLTFGTFSKSLGNAPYHIAKHFGWFDSHPDLSGHKIVYTEYNDRPTISQAFDSGELQMLFSAEAPAIMCVSQGNAIKIVDIASTVFLNFLIRSELEINSVEGMKNRPIALLRGTSSHYGLLKNLTSRNLNVDDFDIRFMSPPEARTAFEGGQIDGWVIWSPFLDIQLMSGKGKELQGTDYPITNTMAVPSELINKDEKIVHAMVSVIERGKEWLVQNPKEACPILAKELNLDLEVVKSATKNFLYNAVLNDEVLTDFQQKANFLAEQDATRQDKPVDIRGEFVDLRFIQ